MARAARMAFPDQGRGGRPGLGTKGERQETDMARGAEGRLPVMPEVERDAQLRKVKLVVLPTKDAIAILNRGDLRTNAILHVTC